MQEVNARMCEIRTYVRNTHVCARTYVRNTHVCAQCTYVRDPHVCAQSARMCAIRTMCGNSPTYVGKVPNQYDWPVKDDVLKGINPSGLFVGPINLKGTCPYIVMGLDEAYKSHTGN